MSVNKVIIIGHLGSNPELRHTTSGHSVTRFNVATNEYWKSKTGEQNEKTEWHRIVAWGRLGEVCHQHLTKGRQVYLEGRLQTRSWEDNQNVKKYSTEVIASTVQFLGANDQKNMSAMSSTTTPQNTSYEEKSYVEEPPFDQTRTANVHSGASSNNIDAKSDSNTVREEMPF